MGDVDELRAAVSNLIDNALKYSGQGARVLVSTSIDEDRYATVRVADNGPGIPGAELKRIFKRFYRCTDRWCDAVKGWGSASTSSAQSPAATAAVRGPKVPEPVAAARSPCSYLSK